MRYSELSSNNLNKIAQAKINRLVETNMPKIDDIIATYIKHAKSQKLCLRIKFCAEILGISSRYAKCLIITGQLWHKMLDKIMKLWE